jgi:hypothetical protein
VEPIDGDHLYEHIRTGVMPGGYAQPQQVIEQPKHPEGGRMTKGKPGAETLPLSMTVSRHSTVADFRRDGLVKAGLRFCRCCRQNANV